MKENKELKRYNIQVDGISYHNFERASEVIGEKRITLYTKVIRCTSKGLPFNRIINGKTVFIEEIDFNPPKKEVLASVKVDFVDLQDKHFVKQLELVLLKNSNLSEEERKNVKFETGYEDADFVCGKITVKASIMR